MKIVPVSYVFLDKAGPTMIFLEIGHWQIFCFARFILEIELRQRSVERVSDDHNSSLVGFSMVWLIFKALQSLLKTWA